MTGRLNAGCQQSTASACGFDMKRRLRSDFPARPSLHFIVFGLELAWLARAEPWL